MDYVLLTIVGGFLAWLGYKPVEIAFEHFRAEGLPFKRKRTQLSGEWSAAWETTAQGRQILNREELVLRQRGIRISVRNLAPSTENPQGGYLWRGEFKIHQREYLIGWYEYVDPAVVARGSLYFYLNPAGKFLIGKWVGCSYDSRIASGNAVVARTREAAMEKLRNVCNKPDNFCKNL